MNYQAFTNLKDKRYRALGFAVTCFGKEIQKEIDSCYEDKKLLQKDITKFEYIYFFKLALSDKEYYYTSNDAKSMVLLRSCLKKAKLPTNLISNFEINALEVKESLYSNVNVKVNDTFYNEQFRFVDTIKNKDKTEIVLTK